VEVVGYLKQRLLCW